VTFDKPMLSRKRKCHSLAAGAAPPPALHTRECVQIQIPSRQPTASVDPDSGFHSTALTFTWNSCCSISFAPVSSHSHRRGDVSLSKCAIQIADAARSTGLRGTAATTATDGRDGCHAIKCAAAFDLPSIRHAPQSPKQNARVSA
jgi:hypothetical protein